MIVSAPVNDGLIIDGLLSKDEVYRYINDTNTAHKYVFTCINIAYKYVFTCINIAYKYVFTCINIAYKYMYITS